VWTGLNGHKLLFYIGLWKRPRIMFVKPGTWNASVSPWTRVSRQNALQQNNTAEINNTFHAEINQSINQSIKRNLYSAPTNSGRRRL